MNPIKLYKKAGFKYLFYAVLLSATMGLISCSTFSYKTYTPDEKVDDPEPDYTVTLNPDFQEYTSYMFIGNRIENFGTYFNTYYNAKENYEEAYDDYELRVLPKYNEQIDSIYQNIPLGQESIDKFNKAIEKASKVIQFHKSSSFMDQAVLLIGKSYYYLGDYLKAERKFNEFISKLTASSLYEEALLYYARTQFRLYNPDAAIGKIESLLKNSTDKNIIAGAYQSLAEHYISKKDFETAIKNYKKSIEFSSDNEFKAQMQFLVASVIARTNPSNAAGEYNKVLNYNTSYELEYYARYNYIKNLILSNKFANINTLLRQLEVDYKETPEFLGEIMLLSAIYYDQSNNPKSLKSYSEVIKTYPKTAASSDASYSIARQYEKKGDYLNAYKYYRFSVEESSQGHYYRVANSKVNVFRRYYELRSRVAGETINTEYDSLFLKNVKNEDQLELEKLEGEPKIKGDESEHGKPGGLKGFFNSGIISDSLITIDSVALRDEEIAKAQFELSELFVYDLNHPDSAERYLLSSFERSRDNDFKSKVLFGLASLYKNLKQEAKAEEVFNKIVKDFPSTPAANESRKQLGLTLIEQDYYTDEADSLYTSAENMLESKKYRDALDTYNNIIAYYPTSKYLIKSYYAAGWIYENILNMNDSAYLYYNRLLEKDPVSEYAKVIGGKVVEYMSNSIGDSTINNIQGDTTKIQDTSGTSGEQKPHNDGNEQPEKITTPTGDENDPTQMKKEEESIQEHPKQK